MPGGSGCPLFTDPCHCSDYLERWAAARKIPALAQMGVDEIYLGKKQKFITVVSNLDTAESLIARNAARFRDLKHAQTRPRPRNREAA
jgi:hypothetical protein